MFPELHKYLIKLPQLTNPRAKQGAVGCRDVTEKGGHKFTLVPPWHKGETLPRAEYCFPTPRH